jgi:penicillin-binding protein 2
LREKKKNIRGVITAGMIFGCFAAFAVTLFVVQIVQGEAYAAKINSISEKTVTIEAARGEILDRNGNPLITNRQGNSIVFDGAFFPPAEEIEQRVEIISGLIKLFEANGVLWIDNLPLTFSQNGTIEFAEDRESDIAFMKSKDMLNLNDYASAQNCFDALIRRYKLENYSPQEARKIASVSYEMKRLIFSVAYPYTFAEDVPGEMVAKIKENSTFFKGVDVLIVPYREYADGALAPHILGMVGAISAEEHAKLKTEGYGLNDIVGKNGIESAMEKELRGVDGIKTVTTDGEGNVTTEITTPPIQGNAVILTIDAKLQKVAQDALKTVLTNADTPVPPAGAVIVINCNTGEILASASYPNYDISDYSKNYAELSKASGAPLWNRALLSTYEAGSTMKPSAALAGLEEQLITKSSTFYCSGLYDYLDMTFKCEQRHANRNVNVVAAINESCNTFFYELGRKLGISKMNQYRTMFGLGQKTGVELNEAGGNLDSPEYRESINQPWRDGYTVQSAVGQANNLFTPVQLANYCAAIANGGTLYQPHFIKSVMTYDYSATLLDKETVVKWETGFTKTSLDIVKEGMLLVGTDGYCRNAFSKLPVKAAAKTGTSQVIRQINGNATKINNGILISYAPGDKPEIAVALVAEGFLSGTRAAPIAAMIYDYYFSNTAKAESPQAENVLLG